MKTFRTIRRILTHVPQADGSTLTAVHILSEGTAGAGPYHVDAYFREETGYPTTVRIGKDELLSDAQDRVKATIENWCDAAMIHDTVANVEG